mmetsp:Transcript_159778/g.512726  ORF Transcript_159778/g.512726 Transcript_159778/m.512726 type:complete len:236 (-) Transcript_159778:2-709(-)
MSNPSGLAPASPKHGVKSEPDRSVVGAGTQRIADGHLQRLGSLLGDHLAVHERVLDARVVLDEPVLAELEVEVLQLVEGEGVVVATVKVADLRLLLGDLGGRARARIRVGTLQAELGRVHVVLFTPLHGCRREGTGPPEEDAEHNVARMVHVENVLARHEVLDPKVLPERRSPVVGDLEGARQASSSCRDELLRFDVPLEGRDDAAREAREEEGHGGRWPRGRGPPQEAPMCARA